MKIHNENYDEMREAKKDRMEARAEKTHKDATELFETAHKMADVIPFGQPILIGHHSEKADRNYRKRISNKMDKACETFNKAKYYDDKLKGMEDNTAISRDDPEAIPKLKAKLEKIELNIQQIKDHNKACKNNIYLRLYDYNDGIHISNNTTYKTYAVIKDKKIEWKTKIIPKEIKAKIENYAKTGKMIQEKIPENKQVLEAYHLQNLSSNKRRIKDRITEIGALLKIPDIDETINNVRLYTDEGRVRIDFGYKPDEETRTKMKKRAWKWSPYNQVWQNYINQRNIDFARELLKELKK